MDNLSYTVRFSANGITIFKFTVPASESGLVGNWHDGKLYQPDKAHVISALPYRYRKAFDRSIGWWQTDSMSGPSLPLRCDSQSLKGKPLGSLFATPDWSNRIDR